MNGIGRRFYKSGIKAAWLHLSALILLFRFCMLMPAAYLTGCANVTAPTGGARDSIPPQLIQARPASYSTEFQGGRITLQFNEFVRIQNRSAIRLLPETTTKPEIREALHRVEVDFDAVELEPATTYVLYCGDGIVDFTEGNKLRDFKHVFSTGVAIDTGWISGRVVDIENAKSRPQVRVGLYDWVEAGDSVVYNRKPRYWTTTDDSGRFYLGYLPDRDFRLFVWFDENKDGRYKAGEAFDFEDKRVRPKRTTYDSSLIYTLRLSTDIDEQARILDCTEKWPGWLGITFSARPTELNWMIGKERMSDSMRDLQYWRGDTLYAYLGEFYKKAELGSVVALCQMMYRTDTILRKTTPLREEARKIDTTGVTLPKMRSIASVTPEKSQGKSYLRFTADVPFERIDASRFLWIDSILGQVVVNGADYTYKEGDLSITIPTQLQAGRFYKLLIPSGTVVGAGGQQIDTAPHIFRAISDSLIKKVSVILLEKQDTTGRYISGYLKGITLELRDASAQVYGGYRHPDETMADRDHELFSIALLPGTYNITLYADQNNNARIDSASWSLNRRAERRQTTPRTLPPTENQETQIDLSELLWK